MPGPGRVDPAPATMPNVFVKSYGPSKFSLTYAFVCDCSKIQNDSHQQRVEKKGQGYGEITHNFGRPMGNLQMVEMNESNGITR